MDKAMPNWAFLGMSMMFKIRDCLHPPAKYIHEIDLKSGDVVLDYGCGPGSFMKPVMDEIGAEGMYYALDLHPNALEKITARAQAYGYSNVKTILSDCKTGLPDHSVDVVLLYDIFHMLSEADAVLAELHRILKPGGLLSVDDPHISEEAAIIGITHTGLYKIQAQGKTLSFVPQDRI